jgi:hypothetical protein
MHLNLWLIDGVPAADQEVIFTDFNFTPAGGASPVGLDDSADGRPPRPAGRLQPAVPNPFNPRTTLRFVLEQDGAVDLAILDLNGRRVRTLLSGPLGAGVHAVPWDGRDGRGRRLASGIYLSVLRFQGDVETGRLVLLK